MLEMQNRTPVTPLTSICDNQYLIGEPLEMTATPNTKASDAWQVMRTTSRTHGDANIYIADTVSRPAGLPSY